jgi:SH3-like domain-containing protein
VSPAVAGGRAGPATITSLVVASVLLLSETVLGVTFSPTWEVHEQPTDQSKTIMTISEADPWSIRSRRGNWLQISTGGIDGWIRVNHDDYIPARSLQAIDLIPYSPGSSLRLGSGEITLVREDLDRTEIRVAGGGPEGWVPVSSSSLLRWTYSWSKSPSIVLVARSDSNSVVNLEGSRREIVLHEAGCGTQLGPSTCVQLPSGDLLSLMLPRETVRRWAQGRGVELRAEILSKPQMGSEVLATFGPGSCFHITLINLDWIKLRLDSQNEGWIRNGFRGYIDEPRSGSPCHESLLTD